MRLAANAPPPPGPSARLTVSGLPWHSTVTWPDPSSGVADEVSYAPKLKSVVLTVQLSAARTSGANPIHASPATTTSARRRIWQVIGTTAGLASTTRIGDAA